MKSSYGNPCKGREKPSHRICWQLGGKCFGFEAASCPLLSSNNTVVLDLYLPATNNLQTTGATRQDENTMTIVLVTLPCWSSWYKETTDRGRPP